MLAETPQNVSIHPSKYVALYANLKQAAVVRPANIKELTNGSARLPYANRSTWFQIQSECSDLRRTRSHLKQGIRQSRKLTNIKDDKRYLKVANIDKDGLLVTQSTDPFSTKQTRIIVPRQVLPDFYCHYI